MTTPRVLTIICLFLLIGIWSCEKAERAVDAIDKAAALKDEVRKEYNDVKKELTDKAEQMRAKISKEILPAKDGENSVGQKRRSDRHKETREDDKD